MFHSASVNFGPWLQKRIEHVMFVSFNTYYLKWNGLCHVTFFRGTLKLVGFATTHAKDAVWPVLWVNGTHWVHSPMFFVFSNQLLRKRHIGNDIVTIVFQEPGALPFTPKNIRSHFQHVFVIVKVHNPCTENVCYRWVKQTSVWERCLWFTP